MAYQRMRPPDGWMLLLLRRSQGRLRHAEEDPRTTKDVCDAIRQKRKEYLGSDLSLSMLIRGPGCRPIEDAIDELGGYLAHNAEAYSRPPTATDESEEALEIFRKFFFYALQMYGRNWITDECFDDLILLAETFENDDVIVSTKIVEQTYNGDAMTIFEERRCDICCKIYKVKMHYSLVYEELEL